MTGSRIHHRDTERMKPKRYTVEEAAKHLSKLIREAENGRDVYITVDGRPVVKVVAIGDGVSRRVPGGLKGKISWTEDAFDPLTDERMRR